MIKALISAASENTTKGDLFSIRIPMGEVDGGSEEAESAQTNKNVLDFLVEEKVLDSYKITSDLEDFDHEQLFIATAECKLSRKGLTQFLKKYSFIPKLSITRDTDGYIVLKTDTELIKIRKPRYSSNVDLFWRCVLAYPNKRITNKDMKNLSSTNVLVSQLTLIQCFER